jgi:heme-degrading monooxygenase HmoA
MPAGFTTDTYDAVNAKAELDTRPPEGLSSHALATSGDQAVIVDVWESQEAFESFRNDRLNPALESIVGAEAFAAMPTPEREFYDVHNAGTQ